MKWQNVVSIYFFKVNNGNTSAMLEICSESTIKTLINTWCLYCSLWSYFTYCCGVSIADLEQVSTSWGGFSNLNRNIAKNYLSGRNHEFLSGDKSYFWRKFRLTEKTVFSEKIVLRNSEGDSKMNLLDYFYLLLQHTDLCIFLEERPFGLHPRNTKVSKSVLFSRDNFLAIFFTLLVIFLIHIFFPFFVCDFLSSLNTY